MAAKKKSTSNKRKETRIEHMSEAKIIKKLIASGVSFPKDYNKNQLVELAEKKNVKL